MLWEHVAVALAMGIVTLALALDFTSVALLTSLEN